MYTTTRVGKFSCEVLANIKGTYTEWICIRAAQSLPFVAT